MSFVLFHPEPLVLQVVFDHLRPSGALALDLSHQGEKLGIQVMRQSRNTRGDEFGMAHVVIALGAFCLALAFYLAG